MDSADTKRVLIVDDDVPILEAIGDLLRAEGYFVREEPESVRAVDSAREFVPDIVLLDLMMPGADGVQVAQGLRRQETTSDVPVVLMTAHPDAARIASEMSAAAWLRKPFSARALLRAVAGDDPDQTNPDRPAR